MPVVHLPPLSEILVTGNLPVNLTVHKNHQVSVECDGRGFRMFMVDLLERCERVHGVSHSGM